MAGFIAYQYALTGYGSIIASHVYFGIARCAAYHILIAGIAAVYLCVHEHAPGGRLVEPSQIEYRFRLAGTEKIPFAVHPGFHPSVIVVGMRPAWRVDLSGRNPDSP
ncbi:hypothetical protein IMSAGC014_01534 [Bacteroidaceae bacterium]|nr:hypothetical protein IMSAGC014_01534 [Bacteroidaceae bacterium]